jgi:hypothetical protein
MTARMFGGRIGGGNLTYPTQKYTYLRRGLDGGFVRM